MMCEVRWMVRYGVDDSHLTECLSGLHSRLGAALDSFNEFSPLYPIKVVQLLRLRFDGDYSVAGDVRVVREKRLNTKTMEWE